MHHHENIMQVLQASLYLIGLFNKWFFNVNQCFIYDITLHSVASVMHLLLFGYSKLFFYNLNNLFFKNRYNKYSVKLFFVTYCFKVYKTISSFQFYVITDISSEFSLLWDSSVYLKFQRLFMKTYFVTSVTE